MAMRILLLPLAFVVIASATGHSGSNPVTFIPASEVTSAFERGRPLTETGLYKIHASRREAAGMAEVHARDIDVIYVLDGAAELVTGGTVVDPKTVAIDEVRGASIAGGVPRALRKGDVMVVPNGVPHWFRQVDGPLLYYVVKVTAAEGGTR
jgi:glc operon protein GlcG